MEPPISIGKLGQWLKNGRDGLKVCVTQSVGIIVFVSMQKHVKK